MTNAEKADPVWIGARLRELREERGLKQYWVAMQLGTTPNALCQVEQGRYRSAVLTVARVLDVLDVSLAEFFAGD